MPPSSDRSHRTLHLPQPLTSFIGREREVATVVDRLRREEVRLLTLTGPGGVGKTRLALVVADQLAGDYPNGAWFVGLAPITDRELVVPAMAQVLGVREAGDESLVERLTAFLRDKCLLLVLDNFEQVVEAAPLLADLLAACPGLMCLVTSRGRLRLSGEHEHPVPPLSLAAPDDRPTIADVMQAEAVRLFLTRAQAVQEGFILTPENASAIAGICHRLDGLPLAIELAAARIKVLPPAALLSRLERRLPLLTGGGRDLPRRQQTMRDTIAWSYDLLSTVDQMLFRTLSVFVGGCTLEAAEVVVKPGGGLDVVEGMTRLVDNSLLRTEDSASGELRFRMLETVREFGLEQLAASGEEIPARRAHAAWFLALAEMDEEWTWGGSEQKRWLDHLEADLPNLRTALAWFMENDDAEAGARLATGLWGFWHLRSHRAEGRSWLERALARDASSDRTRARAQLALGELYCMTGSQRGTDLLEESLALSRELADARGTAEALFLLGIDSRNRGDLARAARLLSEAGELAAEVGDRQVFALARLQLGATVLYQSGAEQAEPMLEEALALHQQQGDTYGVACSLLVLGWVAAMRRDVATAAARYAESLALWEELGTQEGVIDVLAAATELAVVADDLEQAARLLALVEVLAERLGYVIPLPERSRYSRTADAVRATEGGAAFTAVSALGLTITPERAIAEGKTALATLLAKMPPPTPRRAAADHGLTGRELEVLRLLAAGHSNAQIADILFISPRTISTHLTSTFNKLGVSSRTEAIAAAHHLHLV